MTQETFSVRSHHGSKSTVERAAEAIFTACGFFAVLAVASITLYMIFSGTPALFKVGILDADITGPSIPKMFGVHGPAMGSEMGILPIAAEDGTKIMSINLLMEDEEAPVIWRGPVLANMVKQFWTDVVWDKIDYLFVDMPPGTGDVPLTVFQSLPIDGIVIVSSPQDLVKMIVKKAYHMAKSMNVPILGIVENYSYLVCPDCGKKISVFGESHIDEIAKEHELPVLAKLPIDPVIAKHVDEGLVEYLEESWMDEAAKKVLEL